MNDEKDVREVICNCGLKRPDALPQWHRNSCPVYSPPQISPDKMKMQKAFKKYRAELKKKNRNLDFIWEETFEAGWQARAREPQGDEVEQIVKEIELRIELNPDERDAINSIENYLAELKDGL